MLIYNNINEINLKITSYCNMRCNYCFQDNELKDQMNIFALYDELLNFCKSISLSDNLIFKITGGESSLFCTEIEYAYKKLKKLERNKDTKVSFVMTTNGTNMVNILNLMERNILDPKNSKMSWDGLRSSVLRRPKNPAYNDEYFKEQLKLLGNSEFSGQFRVRTAITPFNIDTLDLSLQFLLKNGCTRWEYYFLDDCDKYTHPLFIEKFKKQLKSIINIYGYGRFDFINYNNRHSLKNNIYDCKNIFHSISIDFNGDIYPCLKHLHDKTMCIGNIRTGFDTSSVNYFLESILNVDNRVFKIRDNMHCQKCLINIEDFDEYKTKISQTEKLKEVEIEIFGV